MRKVGTGEHSAPFAEFLSPFRPGQHTSYSHSTRRSYRIAMEDMPKNTKPEGDMLQGTLDMLILGLCLPGRPTDTRSPMPSNSPPKKSSKWNTVPSTRLSIAWKIAAGSPAFWGTSENNRKAKFYRLTPPAKSNSLPKQPDGSA